MAIIVNDALAGASAAVASSKKRPQSFAGHEHSVALGRVRETLVLKRRSRYDTDRFERWRPKDRNGGDVTTLASEASGVEHAGSTSAAGKQSVYSNRSATISTAGFQHAFHENLSPGQTGYPSIVHVHLALDLSVSANRLPSARCCYLPHNALPRRNSYRWR